MAFDPTKPSKLIQKEFDPDKPSKLIEEDSGVLKVTKDYASGALAAFSDVGYATLEGAAALIGQVTGDNKLAKSVSDFRNHSNQFYAGDIPEDIKDKLSYKVTETMAQLPAYIASGAAKLPGLVAMGVNAFQQGRDDYLGTAGVTTETASDEQIQEANKVGGLTAIPTMVLEKFGVSKLMNSVFKEGADLTVKEVSKRVLSTAIAEGTTEGAQTAIQNGVASKLLEYDPDRLISRGVLESMIVGGIASGVFSGGINSTIIAANKLSGGVKDGDINPVEIGRNEIDANGEPTLEGKLKKTIWDNEENIPIVGSSKPSKVGFIANAKDLANQVIEPLSSQVGKISPKLKGELRKLEFNIGRESSKRVEKSKPFVEKLQQLKKKDSKTYNQLSQMLFNGAAQDVNARDKLLKDLKMFEEFQDVQVALNEIYQDAEVVGMKAGGNKQYFMGYLQEYFPRMVQDYEGLKKHYGQDENLSVFEQEIAAREKENGAKLSEHEKGILLESFIKGDMHQRVGTARPKSTMSRRTDAIEPNALKFYKSPEQSLPAYLENMTTAIETKKFLGINDMLVEDGRERVPGRMATVIKEEYDAGRMDAEKERRLRSLIKSRFGVKDAQNSIIGGAKNLGYLATMGNIGSAITQFGDFSYSVIQNGFLPTVRAATGKKIFRMEDLGINRDQVTIEAQDGAQALKKSVDFVFKAVGLTKLDRFAKETNINAAFQKAKRMARGKQAKVLRAKVASQMDNNVPAMRNGKPTGLGEVDQFMLDLKKGNASDLVGLYLFNQLSEIAPISMSEMPPSYAKNPNLRIMWMLKSYTVKQLNFMREQSFSKIASGEKAQVIEGLQNLIKIGTVMMAANATADTLKDFIFGREIDSGDIMIDNILRIFGLSRYVTRKAAKNPKDALVDFFLPPQANIANDLWKDALGARELDELRTLKYVPFVGKFLYWHEGRGKEMERKYKWSD